MMNGEEMMGMLKAINSEMEKYQYSVGGEMMEAKRKEVGRDITRLRDDVKFCLTKYEEMDMRMMKIKNGMRRTKGKNRNMSLKLWVSTKKMLSAKISCLFLFNRDLILRHR